MNRQIKIGINEKRKNIKTNLNKKQKLISGALIAITLILMVLAFTSTAQAGTTKTWTNGHSTGIWNDADNWNPSGVPGSGDDVIFHADYDADCDIDISPTVKSLTIQSGYSGTVDLASYTLTLSGDFEIVGDTFDAGAGKIKFTGMDTTVDIGSTHLYDTEVAKSSYGDLAIIGTLNVDNDLTLTSSGSTQLNSGTIAVEGDVITTNNGISGSATIKFIGSGDQTLGASGGTGQLPHVEIAKTGGTLTIQDTIETIGNWKYTSGTVSAGTSTVKFQGGDTTVDAGSMSFYNLVLDKSSYGDLTIVGTVDIDNDLTLLGYGDSLLKTGTLDVGGSIVTTAYVSGDATISLNGAHTINAGGQSGGLPDLLVTGGTVDASGATVLRVRDLTVSGGTFTAPCPGTLEISRDFTVGGGTFTHNSGTVKFIGGDGTVSIGNTHLYDIKISKGSYGDVTVSGQMIIDNDLIIIGFSDSKINSGTVKVSGDVKTSIAGFSGSGIVEMVGSSANLESTVTWGGVPNLKINKGTWETITVIGDVKVNGVLTITNINSINGGNIRVLSDIVTTDTGVTGTATIKLYDEGPWNPHYINNGGQNGELPNLYIVDGSLSSNHGPVYAQNAGWLGVQSFIMTGGYFKAPSTTMYVSGDFDVDSSATFVHNNGLVIFDGGGAKIIDTDSSTSNTFYNMKIALESWSSRTVYGTVYVDNDFFIAGSSSSNLNVGTIDVTGNVVTTTYIGGDATIHMNGAHTINAGGQSGGMPNLHITGGTVDASGATVVRVRDLILDGGTFTAPGTGNRLEISKDFTKNAGTFLHNNGLVKFIGGSGIVTIGSTHLYDAEISLESWSALTVSGEMYVEHNLFITGSGSSNLNGGTIPVCGDVKTSTIGFDGSGLVKMIGGNSNLESTVTWGCVPNLEIYKGTWNSITVIGDVKVNGDLTITRINQINGDNIRVFDDIVTTDTGVTGTATIKLYREGSWNTHTINAGSQSGELPNLHIVSGIPSHYATIASSAGWLGVQSFIMDSGAYYYAPSSTMYVSGDFDVDGGATFVHNNGLVIFDGNGANTIDTDSSMSNTLYDMEVALSSWTTRTVSGTVYVDNDLTIAGSSSSNLNGGTIDVTGNVVTTTYIGGDATIEVNGAHTINAGGQAGGLPNLLVSGGTTDATNAGVLRVRDLTISGGTFIAPDNTGRLEITRDFTVGGGTYTHNSGLVKFIGGSGTVSIGSTHLYDVTISLDSWATITIGSELSVEGDLILQGSSSSKVDNGMIKVEGDVITTNTGFSGSTTIMFVGSNDQTLGALGGTGQVSNVEIDKSSGTLTIEDTIEVVGDWTHTLGTVDSGTSIIKFQGGSKTVDASGMTFNDVILDLSSWAGLTASSQMDISSDLTIQGSTSSQLTSGTIAVEGDVTTTNNGFSGSGTIKFVGSGTQTLGASSGTGQLPYVDIAKTGGSLSIEDTIEVVGDWDYTSGTVNSGSSTVKFQGSGRSVNANGMSFYNVIVNLGSWAGFTIESNLDVNGYFTLQCSSTAKLIMEHSGADIDVTGDVDLNGGGIRVDCHDYSTSDNLIVYGGTLSGTFSSVSLINNANGLSLNYGDGSDDAISVGP